jgi:hypothetical protein
MWDQWFCTPGLRFNTGKRLTVLKFEGAEVTGMSPAGRRAQLIEWEGRAQEDGFADELAGLAFEAYRRWAVQASLDLTRRET